MAKSFDKPYIFCRFFILLYWYTPPQTLQLSVWVCEEFLSSALHQSAPVYVRNASVENEKSFLFWADGWHLLSSNRPLLELGELWLWLALISLAALPLDTRERIWLADGDRRGAGSQGQDGIVPLRYHIPAWLMQHSWSSRSTSALGASPNSWASLACIAFLLTL